MSAILGGVELRRLETFVTVADERSFSRAAQRLHVVQSAVSATIKTLERELAVTVFDRTAHRVELTDAGRALLPEARRTLAAAGAARDAIDEFRGGLRGVVRLGVMLSQRQPWRAVNVPRLLSSFGRDHPNVEVELRQAPSAEHAADLRAGRLDLAYVALPRVAAEGLELTPLSTLEMQLLVPAGHRLAGRASVELGALADEPFADGPAGWGIRMGIDRAFAAANATRRVVYTMSELRSLVEFVHYGLAVTILPRELITPADDVCAVPIRHHAPQFTMSIARARDHELGAAAQALLSAIRAMA